MDNAIFVALSRQMVLRREMDIVANNIANADTVGFKVEALMVKTDAMRSASTAQGPKAISFVVADGVARDFGQGQLRRTDGPLDMAVEGEGFFKLTTPEGERFTRDGRFRTDEVGKLVSHGGATVADEGGSEIVVDPKLGQVSVSQDGTVTQNGQRVGKIGVFTFDSLSVLSKVGDNLLENTSNLPAKASEDAKVRQGMLEGSNVKPILEIARMIEVSRAYESTAKLMDSETDLQRRTIERMGKVQ